MTQGGKWFCNREVCGGNPLDIWSGGYGLWCKGRGKKMLLWIQWDILKQLEGLLCIYTVYKRRKSMYAEHSYHEWLFVGLNMNCICINGWDVCRWRLLVKALNEVPLTTWELQCGNEETGFIQISYCVACSFPNRFYLMVFVILIASSPPPLHTSQILSINASTW